MAYKGKYNKTNEGEVITMDYKTMNIKDIAAWCQANGQLEWLKQVIECEVDYEVYPRKRVAKLDKDGNPVLTKKGKPAMTWVADTDAEPTIEKRPISFVQIKKAFCEKFAAELNLPKKGKEPNMFDFVRNL